MQIGISTSCYYPATTEQSLETLLQAGVKTLEVFFNSHSELEEDYLLQLRRMADNAGARILSVHPYTSGMEGLLFFSNYDRRFQDARTYYRKYYRAANLLGAEIVVFHGAYKGQTIAVEEYAQRMDVLDGDATLFGVTLAQENVERNLSRSPQFLAQLGRLRPNQRFVFDLKQAVRSQADPLEVLEAMGSGVVHLHLSDHTPEEDCLPPGLGQTDFSRLFASLSAGGYSGSAVIELYRQNFADQNQLDQSLSFLRSFF